MMITYIEYYAIYFIINLDEYILVVSSNASNLSPEIATPFCNSLFNRSDHYRLYLLHLEFQLIQTSSVLYFP